MMTHLATSFILAIAYRIRGGGFFKFNTTTSARLVFVIAFGSAFGFYLPAQPFWPGLVECLVVDALIFSAIILPHGCFMDMGRYPKPSNDWSFILHDLTQDDWDKLPQWRRTLYDYHGMTLISLIRACIVYIPLALWLNFNPWLSIVAITILQPLAYLVCYYINLDIQWPWLRKRLKDRYGSIAEAKTTEWAELLCGLAWAISIFLI